MCVGAKHLHCGHASTFYVNAHFNQDCVYFFYLQQNKKRRRPEEGAKSGRGRLRCIKRDRGIKVQDDKSEKYAHGRVKGYRKIVLQFFFSFIKVESLLS